MHERGGEAHGIEHRAAADGKDERVTAETQGKHLRRHFFDASEIVLRLLPARNDHRPGSQLDAGGMRSELVPDLRDQLRAGSREI